MADKAFTRYVRLAFDKAAGARMQQEAQDALEAAGKSGGEEFTKAMEAGGSRAAKALSAVMRKDFNAEIASGRLDLAKGIIDEKEFARRGKEAAAKFNVGMVAGMEKLRGEGKLTESQFGSLARQLRRVGDEGARDMGRVGSALETLKGKAVALGASVAAAFAFGKIKAFAADAVGAYVAMEESQLRLRSMVEANGGAVGRTAEQLQAFSKTLQRETLAQGDEIDLAMSQLLSYHSITGDTFERTIRLGADLSSVFGGLTQSTEAVARALDDPIAGLAMLTKRGFTFEESTKSQIAALVEQNRIFEAQDVILRDLEGQVGGVAARMKTGMVGALDNLSKGWMELKEEIGAALVAGEGGASVMEILSGTVQGLTEWVSRNRDSISGWVSGGIKVATVSVKALAAVVLGLGNAISGVLLGATALWTAELALLTKGAALAVRGIAWLDDLVGNTKTAERWTARADAIDRNADALMRYARAAGAESLKSFRDVIHPFGGDGGETGSAAAAEGDATPNTRRTGPTGPLKSKEEIEKEAKAREEAIRKEIASLKTLRDANRLTGADRMRAMELEEQLTKQLAAGNLTLAERAAIAEKLKSLSAITGGPTVAGLAGASGPAVVGGMNRQEVRLQAMETASLFSETFGRIYEDGFDAADGLTAAWSQFFTRFADGLRAGVGGFAALKAGAVGMGRAVVGQMSEGWAAFSTARGTAALAEGTWPPNPAALLSATKWFAAAGLFRSLGGMLAHGGGGFASTAPAPGLAYAQSATTRGSEVHVYVNPFDPTNAVQATQIGKAVDLHVHLENPPWAAA